ncbi:MAG TPA: hypothetical protein PLQ93_12580 [Bacteroidia bacterium]|nr:hypothetical protein [Bacteroidia bacterium]
MEKRNRYLAIAVFLCGMLVSIFNFLPYLHEENPGSKIELCQKSDLADTGDDQGPEQNHDFSAGFINQSMTFLNPLWFSTSFKPFTSRALCECTLQMLTPPPKV